MSAHETDDAICEGAKLLLQLNRNKYYYQRVLASPKFYKSNVEYELRKFLKMRLAKKTSEDVKRMIREEMPRAKEILDEARTSDGVVRDENGSPFSRKGKRPDHDFLPENIAKLWDDNAERYKKIKSVFETLKDSEDKEPCDRYEDCQMLVDLDRRYRADMMKYDDYIVTDEDRRRVCAKKQDDEDKD